jgi:hypothetical protein
LFSAAFGDAPMIIRKVFFALFFLLFAVLGLGFWFCYSETRGLNGKVSELNAKLGRLEKDKKPVEKTDEEPGRQVAPADNVTAQAFADVKALQKAISTLEQRIETLEDAAASAGFQRPSVGQQPEAPGREQIRLVVLDLNRERQALKAIATSVWVVTSLSSSLRLTEFQKGKFAGALAEMQKKIYDLWDKVSLDDPGQIEALMRDITAAKAQTSRDLTTVLNSEQLTQYEQWLDQNEMLLLPPR